MHYPAKFIESEEVARDTRVFYFQKPPEFAFKAGQFIEVTLLNPPETDAQGNRRAYSIASAPYEKNLMIATRLRDTAFKRILRSLPPETNIDIEGPFGDFTLGKNAPAEKPAVFLAGGIGITPARSIILQATQEQSPRPLYLFYSNRQPEDAAFLQELIAIQKKNSCFKLITTFTQGASAGSEAGYINPEMIKRHLDLDRPSPTYYIAGPAAMTLAMRTMLETMKVNEDDIKTEEFSGY